MSSAPRPTRLPSRMVPCQGGTVHLDSSPAGTTSTCPFRMSERPASVPRARATPTTPSDRPRSISVLNRGWVRSSSKSISQTSTSMPAARIHSAICSWAGVSRPRSVGIATSREMVSIRPSMSIAASTRASVGVRLGMREGSLGAILSSLEWHFVV